jgi:serine/threonine-protein kinase RsbW
MQRSMMDYSTSCGFVADPTGVASVDDWVERLASQWGVDGDTAYKARLCISELAANLIMHDDKTPGPTFVVTLVRNGRDASVEFTDNGNPFDPTASTAHEPSAAGTPRIGGLGLHLIRSYASRVVYKREIGQNHTRLDFVGRGQASECSAEDVRTTGP